MDNKGPSLNVRKHVIRSYCLLKLKLRIYTCEYIDLLGDVSFEVL